MEKGRILKDFTDYNELLKQNLAEQSKLELYIERQHSMNICDHVEQSNRLRYLYLEFKILSQITSGTTELLQLKSAQYFPNQN